MIWSFLKKVGKVILYILLAPFAIFILFALLAGMSGGGSSNTSRSSYDDDDDEDEDDEDDIDYYPQVYVSTKWMNISGPRTESAAIGCVDSEKSRNPGKRYRVLAKKNRRSVGVVYTC